MWGTLLGKLATLKQERGARWATESHHCTACGVAFNANQECKCEGSGL